MSTLAAPPEVPTAATPRVPVTGVDISERPAWAANGFVGTLVVAVLLAGAIMLVVWLPDAWKVLSMLFVVSAIVIGMSLITVPPGGSAVVEFFGRYVGTVREPGFSWIMPLSTRRRISVRVRNFETGRIKVNDAGGSPIEIVAIVVWRVADTAKAAYAVDDYEQFVFTQAESALRRIAGSYPYDGKDGEESLRGSTPEVSDELAAEVGLRTAVAGVEIVEVRISHLAYAPEIAQVMLRRQQADAVVAARKRIVKGAVGMVELALRNLSEQNIVDLDDERRAAMVSNLMVVLCSDQPTAPIVNAGTLYTS
ncbi:MAG: SPFH domain-containing protein [Microbacterium sp.]|uniref:SPFH domain-containing protein n=1 Tax=Microbacterium sp. TaxID=51671 RepID=UPI0039E49B61